MHAVYVSSLFTLIHVPCVYALVFVSLYHMEGNLWQQENLANWLQSSY